MERRVSRLHRWLAALGFAVAGVMGIAPAQAQELCGGVDYPFPYTDVSSVGAVFCPGIMEAYVTGVSRGTTPTTFSPNETVIRLQMTTFLQRSLDQGLARTSRRAALEQWWTPQAANVLQTIAIGGSPSYCVADGEDIWASNQGEVVQVQANTGKILGTWTGATQSLGMAVAAGKVFVVGNTTPGSLFVIDPTLPPGSVTLASSALGSAPLSIAFDGTNLWTANYGGSVSIINPQTYAVTTVSTGFNNLEGIVFDGSNMWVTDYNAATLMKLSNSGAILQTVSVGAGPTLPIFDGTNIWVPGFSNSITVVQASTGNVVATITPDSFNHLAYPFKASFDGERVLVTNFNGSSVTVFKAADLSFIANVPIGLLTEPYGACSDGINFWVQITNTGNLLRF